MKNLHKVYLASSILEKLSTSPIKKGANYIIRGGGAAEQGWQDVHLVAPTFYQAT